MGIPFCLLKPVLDSTQEMQFTLSAFEKAEARKVSLLCESVCFQNRVSLQKWRGDGQESKSNLTKAGSGGHAVVELKNAAAQSPGSKLSPSEQPAPWVAFQSHYNTEDEPKRLFIY